MRMLLLVSCLCLLGGCVISQVNHVPRVAATQPTSAPVAKAEATDADQSRVRLWPIYYSRPMKEGGRERWILWPFFVQRKSPELEMTNLFPLYSKGVKFNPNETKSSFLFTPIYMNIRNNVPLDPGEVAPIYYRSRGLSPLYVEETVGENAIKEKRLIFLFRWGKDAQGNYARLWPLPKLRMGGV